MGSSQRLSWPSKRTTITPRLMTDEEIDRLIERIPQAGNYFRLLIPAEEE